MHKKGHFTVYIVINVFYVNIEVCNDWGIFVLLFLCRSCGGISKILTFNSIFQ